VKQFEFLLTKLFLTMTVNHKCNAVGFKTLLYDYQKILGKKS